MLWAAISSACNFIDIFGHKVPYTATRCGHPHSLKPLHLVRFCLHWAVRPPPSVWTFSNDNPCRFYAWDNAVQQHWPAAGLQHGSLDLQWRHAKVRHSYVVAVVEQEILRLQISVTETQTNQRRHTYWGWRDKMTDQTPTQNCNHIYWLPPQPQGITVLWSVVFMRFGHNSNPSSLRFVILMLFSIMNHVSRCDLYISSNHTFICFSS